MTSMAEEREELLYGLAFPIIRVRYSGPTNNRGSRWFASIKHGDELTRASDSFEDERGRRNHFAVARACWAKYRAQHSEAFEGDEDERVFIPGNAGPDEYVFTVVPRAFLS